MNGGYKEIVQETGNYQEILNTVVGSKVYYMFQEEVHKVLVASSNIQLGNKIALDETLQYLWWEYETNSINDVHIINTTKDVWNTVMDRIRDEGFNPPTIEADTFEEFLEELKEMKLEKSSQRTIR